MIIHEVKQKTPEWYALRLGIPTASQFSRIITPSGEKSKSQEDYMFELLAERMTGKEDVFSSKYTEIGNEQENEAVCWYEFQNDCETEKVGFVTNDARTMGASPDRFVGDNGMLEVKIVKPAHHVRYLIKKGTAYREHGVQVQAQLWICEKDFSDLLAYNQGMPRVIVRTPRDEEFIGKMAKLANEFSDELERHWANLVESGMAQELVSRPVKSMVDILRESLEAIQGA